MTAKIIPFPDHDERAMRLIFSSAPKPSEDEAYEKALARQRGEPLGMFREVAK